VSNLKFRIVTKSDNFHSTSLRTILKNLIAFCRRSSPAGESALSSLHPNCAQTSLSLRVRGVGAGEFNLPECLVISGGLVGMPIRRVQVKTIYLLGARTFPAECVCSLACLIPRPPRSVLFSPKEKTGRERRESRRARDERTLLIKYECARVKMNLPQLQLN